MQQQNLKLDQFVYKYKKLDKSDAIFYLKPCRSLYAADFSLKNSVMIDDDDTDEFNDGNDNDDD